MERSNQINAEEKTFIEAIVAGRKDGDRSLEQGRSNEILKLQKERQVLAGKY